MKSIHVPRLCRQSSSWGIHHAICLNERQRSGEGDEVFSRITNIVLTPRCAGRCLRPWRRKVVNRFGPGGIYGTAVHYLHLMVCCKIAYTPLFLLTVHTWMQAHLNYIGWLLSLSLCFLFFPFLHKFAYSVLLRWNKFSVVLKFIFLIKFKKTLRQFVQTYRVNNVTDTKRNFVDKSLFSAEVASIWQQFLCKWRWFKVISRFSIKVY